MMIRTVMMTMTVMITTIVADDADEDESLVILVCQPPFPRASPF